jgi:hypothetical protein
MVWSAAVKQPVDQSPERLSAIGERIEALERLLCQRKQPAASLDGPEITLSGPNDRQAALRSQARHDELEWCPSWTIHKRQFAN